MAGDTADDGAASRDLRAFRVMLTPADHRRFRILAARTDQSLQALGLRALNLLLAEYGEDPVPPTPANVPSGLRKRPRNRK